MRTAAKTMILIAVTLLVVACQDQAAQPSGSTSDRPPAPTTTTSLLLSDAEQAWCDLATQPEHSEALVEAAMSLEPSGNQDLAEALAEAAELRSSFPENDPAGQQAFETRLVTAVFDWFQTNGENAFQRACAAAHQSR